jgi:hypothetical protein
MQIIKTVRKNASTDQNTAFSYIPEGTENFLFNGHILR